MDKKDNHLESAIRKEKKEVDHQRGGSRNTGNSWTGWKWQQIELSGGKRRRPLLSVEALNNSFACNNEFFTYSL